MGKIRGFGIAILSNLISEARVNARNRKNSNLHGSYAENCQKIINAIDINSYIAPHRHLLDPKIETLIALSGSFALIAFDDNGVCSDVVKFRAQNSLDNSIDCFGLDIFPETWHTVIALERNSVLLEIKDGPFIPNIAKEFASWAPPEGIPESITYFNGLKKIVL